MTTATTTSQPFRIAIDDDELADLRDRLPGPAGPRRAGDPAGAAACRSTTCSG